MWSFGSCLREGYSLVFMAFLNSSEFTKSSKKSVNVLLMGVWIPILRVKVTSNINYCWSPMRK
jgi:hypothetical protein